MVVIGAFYLLIFVVGVLARRRSAGGSTTGLLLADRRMPLLIGAFTMTATWVGGGYINGTAEVVFDVGSEMGGLLWAQAPWGYALSLVLGGLFFARTMRRHGFTTLLDPFERRYGRPVAALLYIPALVGEIFWSAAILAALGMTFSVILGFDISTSILISAAIAVAYTMIGGLWAVACTDVVQLVLLFLGLCIAIPFALAHTGGVAEVIPAYLERMPSLPHHAQRWQWLELALLLILGGIPWQVYFQRVLACRDEKTAVNLSLIAAVGCVLMAAPAVLIGAIGTAAWPDSGPGSPPTASLVLPYVLRYLTPPPVAILGLAAVAAAVMSSVDSSVLSASSMFAWNVYRPLARPSADDRELRRVVRAGVLLVGVAATWLALKAQSVYVLWVLCADLVYVVLFPQLVTVLFLRRANRSGAIAGAAVALALRLGGGEPELGLPALIPYEQVGTYLPTFGSHFPFRTFAMLTGLGTIWLISKATGRWDPARPLRLSDG